MTGTNILIIDDEPDYLELLKGILLQEGYENVITEKNPLNALSILGKEKVDLIILDVYMPEMNGIELLEKICLKYPAIPVIMVTAVNDIEIALRAIKLGAYEFITKPPNTERLFLIIKRALEQKLLELERDLLRKQLPMTEDAAMLAGLDSKKYEKFSEIITKSPLMLNVFDLVEIFSPTNETVLISGETGTGKDLIARKIHELSSRKNQPFVIVNIASISSTLFESELFGHEKGSFTGAASERIGYFEAANGGTIFLDEIGELPKDLQGKILRTIQYNEIYRIGNARSMKLDIRIIAATNKDLNDAVNKNEFRADLYYRLNRGFIQLPPLRNRTEDIEPLARYFIEIGCKTYNKRIKGISKNVITDLMLYSFPGNVRELENLIMNAVAKTKNGEMISSVNLSVNQPGNAPFKDMRLMTIKEAAEEHIRHVLNSTKWDLKKSAKILGISERTLHRKLKSIREN